MSKKPDIRSLCNPQPRLAESTQLALLHGEIYFFKDRDKLFRSIRRGSLVEVVEGYLLAKPTGRSDSRKRDWLKAVDEIESRGGVVWESSTGRRSDKPKEAREMQAQAFEQIASSGRGRKSALVGALSKGAPRWNPTPEAKAVAEKEWFSRKHRTDNERMTAIQAKLGKDAPSRTTMRKYFGSPYATKQ